MATHPSARKVDRTPLTGRLTIHPQGFAALSYISFRKLANWFVIRLPLRELPEKNPGTPDIRSPFRYLFWIARNQKWLLVMNAGFGIGWMLCQALLWAAVGVAIDKGVAHHSLAELLRWSGIVMLLGLVQALCGMFRHQLAVTNWMNAAYRTVQAIGHHVATTGSAVTDVIQAGDIVNTVAADAMRIGGAFDVFARFMGAIISWLVVSFILLSSSLQLGLIVLLGVPLLASLTTPLMKPLHAAQAAQREAAGRLAALGSDTVTGLRILRGVGGEEVFLNNYVQQSQKVKVTGWRIAWPQAGLESGQVLLPALLTATITYLGARDVMNHSLQPGQLVAFFGYTTFLTTPLRTAIEYVISTTRAYVGAGRVLRILSIKPTIADVEHPLAWPTLVTSLQDHISGISLHQGDFVGLVTESPAEASYLCDRLARFVPDSDGVQVNGADIASFLVADVRTHIVMSEVEPRLFSGELRYELIPHGDVNDERIMKALEATSSLDILEALDDGLRTTVEERGRSFSGGQRQRLSLTRAVLTEADILLLVEPTSAVDTHTESRIANRLGEARQSKTTLIASTSPVMLEKMQQVFLVINNHVVDKGTHRELIARSQHYRQIVLREDN